MTAPCLPCCGGTPTECACALLIPFDPSNITPSTPYSDYATAASAIADYVYDCILYANGNPSSVTVDTSIADEITAVVSTSTGVGTQEDFICLNLYSGESLTIDYDLTTSEPDGDFFAAIYDCTGTQISFDRVTDGPLNGTLDLGTVPADGIYKVYVTTNEFIGTSSFELVFNSTGIFANPVIAQWDDSGTTRQLEACPKMLLPPLTESDGSWYTDETEAQAIIDYFTGDCLVYSAVPDTIGPRVSLVVSYTPGTSLSVLCDSGTNGNELDCSLNLDAASVLTLDYSLTSSSSPTGGVSIYDYSGTLLDSAALSSGTHTVTLGSGLPGGGLPYNGRYILVVQGGNAPGHNVTFDLEYTSTGALTANPIQALYATDPLLDCPARLDCL